MTNPFDLIAAAPTALAPTTPFVSDALAPSEGFVVPVAPLTKTLFGFQAAAVEAILTHRRVLLGHRPGYGKTLMAQTAIAALAANGERTVVVVPPSLRIDPWANAFAADFPHLRVVLVEGTKRAPIDAGDVVIVGDSVLSQRLDDLLAWAPTAVFGDEAHRYKSRDAKRSKAMLALANSVNTVVPMTGTLAVNGVHEIYMPLAIAGVAGRVSHGASWTSFRTEWCVTESMYIPSLGRTIEKVVGAKDAPGLHRRLRETCYVRVDGAIDLPNKGWNVHSLALNGAMAKYRRMERDFIAFIRQTKGDAAAKRAAKAEAISMLMALWAEAGVASAKVTAEYVAGMVEQGESVVIMAWHGEAIAALTAALTDAGINSVTYKGGMSSQQKADATSAFQSGATPVLVGQIEAAGTGITLHRAANLVFMQLPWSPGAMQQAADRIWRIGQTRDVTMHVLNAQDSAAERMWAVVNEKAAVVDAINAGQPVTIDPDSVIESVLAGYGW